MNKAAKGIHGPESRLSVDLTILLDSSMRIHIGVRVRNGSSTDGGMTGRPASRVPSLSVTFLVPKWGQEYQPQD